MLRGAGVVVTQELLPTAAELAELGLLDGWVRCLVTDVRRFDRQLAELDWPTTVRVCALLEGQTLGVGGDFAGWEETVRDFAARLRGRVQAVECGNELDVWRWQPPVGQPNPRLTPRFAAELVRAAAPHLRAAGMKVIAPAVASGRWAEYLAELAAELGGAADYQAFHPYGKRIEGHPPHADWEELEPAILRARALAGRPLALTEVGVKVGEVGGPPGQAEYVRRLFRLVGRLEPGSVELFCYFAWKDGAEAPGEGLFGLLEADGRWREAGRAFRQARGGSSPVERGAVGYRLGFARWARLEPTLLGAPLEDETSPFPGFSVQRTERGLLVWAGLDGGVYLFEDHSTGRRRVWRDGWPSSQRVMG